MGPLCVPDSEYGFYDKKIESFGQFLPQTSVFTKTEGIPFQF
jgi:hypothetical protein